jgi:hypothetical protein
MRKVIQDIMALGHTEAEAIEIEDTINSEWLLDWSECSTRQFKSAVKLTVAFIANGKSWE